MKNVNKYLVATLLLSNVLATATDLPDLKAAPTPEQLAAFDNKIKNFYSKPYLEDGLLRDGGIENARDHFCQDIAETLTECLNNNQTHNKELFNNERLSSLTTCVQLNKDAYNNKVGFYALNTALVRYQHYKRTTPAAINRYNQIIKIFVAGSADRFTPNGYDNILECWFDTINNIALLAKNGSNLDTPFPNGELPIIRAVRWVNIDIVKTLLDNNVKTDVLDENGLNLIEAALDNYRNELDLTIGEYYKKQRIRKSLEFIDALATLLPNIKPSEKYIEIIQNNPKFSALKGLAQYRRNPVDVTLDTIHKLQSDNSL